MRVLFSMRLLLIVFLMLALSGASFAQVRVGVAITIAPPELPVYEQPLCPGDGYIWTPGYWAWGDDDYYWVPGTWVLAPEIGLFWTPAYWAWGDGGFVFYEGYWGPAVGFYGGINYGFGYFGHGYDGGRWDNGHFYYNRSVNNVNVTEIHNVYNERVIKNSTLTRVSYNGGNGGINERPTTQEQAAMRERHISPAAAQVQHVQAARANRSLHVAENHGTPPVAATPKPGAFNDRGAMPTREGAHYNMPARPEENTTRPESNHGQPNAARPSTAFHPNELPPPTRTEAPNTGNAKLDQKYQKQQDKLLKQQNQERQKLQQKQEQEHQRLAQQKANDARKQQIEQKHQQQTQQLVQKHAQQQQQLQQRQQPPHQNPSRPPKGKP